MKRFILVPIFLLFTSVNYGQTYMDELTTKVCDCVRKIEDTTDEESYTMAMGICMIESATPYKKELKKDYGIDFDNIDATGDKLGYQLGIKMAGKCPEVITRVSKLSKTKEETQQTIEGTIVKIDSEPFVVFNIKDKKGKTGKYYWMKFIKTEKIDLPTEYKNLIGKEVEIEYIEEEYFDPKIEQYRNFNIVQKMKQIK